VTEGLASSLMVEKGECDTYIINLGKGKHVLGKLPYADTNFKSVYVSRYQAVVLEEEGRYKVFDGNGRDKRSKSGTSVNGKTVVEQGQTLDHNDTIELAKGEVILRFRSTQETLPFEYKVPTKKGLVVDDIAHRVYVDDQLVLGSFPPIEFNILNYLYSRKGELCSKDDIYKEGWPGSQGDVSDVSIHQAIHRIREVVEPSLSAPQYIITITGYGYRLDTPVLPAPKT
jgi:pSer/pThr/pTyr-binding forkhead associated (FHA) protein